MISSFENYHPTRIIFSPQEEFDFVEHFWDCPTLLVVSQSVLDLYPEILFSLPQNIVIHPYEGNNPDLHKTDLIEIPEKCSQVIGIGGGSVLDIAKACFAKRLARGEYQLKELLLTPKILENYRDSRSSLQLLLIPTTFGTSAELTQWGTIWDWQEHKKYSISHELLYANKAIICPYLSKSVPWRTTAYTGLDVLSHAMESIWNRDNNYLTRLYATEAIRLCVKTLPLLLKNLNSLDYRMDQARAAILSGLAFSQTKTAAAHSLSYPLTLFHHIPHGYACSLTLGVIFDYNFPKCQNELEDVYKLFQDCYGRDSNSFQVWFDRFLKDCDIPRRLGDYGVARADIPRLVDNAFHPERFNNMEYILSKEEVQTIYETLL